MIFSLSIIIAQLFKAYGKEADELSMRTYAAALKQVEQSLVERAIAKSVNGHHDKLPTVAQLMRLVDGLRTEDASEGDRNRVEHSQITSALVQDAIKAGWSLAQRDELIAICDDMICKRTGRWKLSKKQWNEEVNALIVKVKDYKRRCAEAVANETDMPDELEECWAWALPKEGEPEDWDPAKESLWDMVKRLQ